MPTYLYSYLDGNGEITEETFELFHSMKEDAYVKHPENGRPCKRLICAPSIKHTGPAWEWCKETRKYINESKPKFIRDDEAGVRMKFPKGGV